MRRSALFVCAVTAIVVGVADGTAWGAAPKNKVLLVEFKVKSKADSIPPGRTKFVVRNAGTRRHELVVVRVDDQNSLETAADGSVDEERIRAEDRVAEFKPIKPGRKRAKTISLSDGTYVLFCNIVERSKGGSVISHYDKGMRRTLEVRSSTETIPPNTNTQTTVTTRPPEPSP